MKISRENADKGTAVIKVSIEKGDYEKNVADKLREYRQKMALPGFRPGKVPGSLIQKRFGKGVMAEEVNQLLSQNLMNYLRDEKLNIIGDPLPNKELQQPIDFDTQEDFEFIFDIALTPEINLTLDKSHSVDYYRIKLEEKMVDDNIDQIRSQFGKTAPVETVTAECYVRGNYVEVNEDGSEKAEGIKTENVLVSVDLIKDENIKASFIGKSVGDTLTFDPVVAFNDRHEVGHMLNISHEAAESLNAQFTYTITEIEQFTKAEVNEELFKLAFGEDSGIETEEQFRQKISENLIANLDTSSMQRFEIDAKAAMLDLVPVELPEGFLKRWLKESNSDLEDAKIEADFENFSRDLKWQLIKNHLINQNKVEVSEDETFDLAKSIALSQYQQYGIYSVADEHLSSFATRILEKQEDRERIVNRLFETKVFELIREQVNLTEKEVDTDQFRALYN